MSWTDDLPDEERKFVEEFGVSEEQWRFYKQAAALYEDRFGEEYPLSACDLQLIKARGAQWWFTHTWGLGGGSAPCSPGCKGHVSHPCEKCGRQWDGRTCYLPPYRRAPLRSWLAHDIFAEHDKPIEESAPPPTVQPPRRR